MVALIMAVHSCLLQASLSELLKLLKDVSGHGVLD